MDAPDFVEKSVEPENCPAQTQSQRKWSPIDWAIATFQKQVEFANMAASILLDVSRFGFIDAAQIKRIDEIEHDGDRLRRIFSSRLPTCGVKAADRADLLALSDRLDDIIDCVEGAASRAELYLINALRPDVAAFCKQIVNMAALLNEALVLLLDHRNETKFIKVLEDMHRVESDCDKMFAKAISALFDGASDPYYVMKHKEIYDRLERAVDKAESAADLIEALWRSGTIQAAR